MDKRQNEIERLMLDYEKQCVKDLQKTYTEALADVKIKLRELLGRDQTQSVVYQIEFQRTLEAQLQSAIDTLKSGSITSVTDFLNRTYEDSYLGTIYGIQGQGIPINIGIDHKQAARVINRKTDTFKFSDRLYKNVDELAVAFKSEMTRGIANNSGYTKIAKQLSLVSEASYKRALTIVRTEGGRVKSEAKLDSMKDAKNEGADIVKQWDATFDGKTRPEHKYLDGQIREIDEPFTDSQGREAQAPHKFGVASMDINCRCIVVTRARWAVEGEEMPNKVDNATGDLVEAKDYKEWKEKAQKQLNEKKEAQFNKRKDELEKNGVKVFDKNTKNIPKKGDYFQTTSKELVEIVEISDYNGIKTVTLANGETVVLKNAKEITKLNANNFPTAFTDSKRTQTQTQKLIDYVNGIDGADEKAKRVLSKLGDLESFDGQGIPFSITYGAGHEGSALTTWHSYGGTASKAKLQIPRLDGDDIKGAVHTTIHETGHLVDYYAGTSGKKFGTISTKNAKLMSVIDDGLGDVSDEITDLFKKANADYDEISKAIDYNAQLRAITDTYKNGGYSSYKAYSQAWNKAKKDGLARRSTLARNKLDGVNNLQDIYDALSGGKYRDSGVVRYGHGTKYFRDKDNRALEIFANYFDLSITRPDLIDVLRRDKPKLVEALDEIMDELLRG